MAREIHSPFFPCAFETGVFRPKETVALAMLEGFL